METKKTITGFTVAMVFAGLIVCPALARKYDTMMVGPDRWIDTEYLNVHCGNTNEIAFNEDDLEEPNNMAFYEGDDEDPNDITYDGQLEPNTITLIYYPAEHPEEPNDTDFENELEPNLIDMFYQPDEHPEEPNNIDYEEDIDPNLMLIYLLSEHPNSIDYEDDIEPNNVLIYVKAEHPEEPNEISAKEEEIDPNDIENIILDEGTANQKATKPNIAKSS